MGMGKEELAGTCQWPKRTCIHVSFFFFWYPFQVCSCIKCLLYDKFCSDLLTSLKLWTIWPFCRREQLEKAQTADPVNQILEEITCFFLSSYFFAITLNNVWMCSPDDSALECFSVGDGASWEDAWFYAASESKPFYPSFILPVIAKLDLVSRNLYFGALHFLSFVGLDLLWLPYAGCTGQRRFLSGPKDLKKLLKYVSI